LRREDEGKRFRVGVRDREREIREFQLSPQCGCQSLYGRVETGRLCSTQREPNTVGEDRVRPVCSNFRAAVVFRENVYVTTGQTRSRRCAARRN
jgi:hypothetical protein